MLVSGFGNARLGLLNSMRRITLIGNFQNYSKRDGPADGEIVDDNLQQPLENQVLVKILSTPYKSSRTGEYIVKSKIPALGGNACVAEVLRIGKNVSKVSAGQHVLASTTEFGSMTIHAIFNEEQLMPVSDDIALAKEPTITDKPCAAYRMLKDFAPLGEGDWVIQNAANSAVGQAVHQLCKAWNLKSLGVVPNREDVAPLKEQLLKLGATIIMTEDEIRQIELPQDGKPRLALNCVGGKSATELLRHLGEEGVMVTYDDKSCEPVFASASALIFKGVSIRGFGMSRWTKENFYTPQRKQMLEELRSLIENGQLLPTDKDIP